MTEVCAPTRRKFVLLNQKNQIKFLLLLFPLQPKKSKRCFQSVEIARNRRITFFLPFSHKRFPCTFQTCQSDWFIARNSLVRIDQHYTWRNWHAQKYKGKKLTDKCLDFLWSRLFDFHLASTIFHNFFISKQMYLTSYFHCLELLKKPNVISRTWKYS